MMEPDEVVEGNVCSDGHGKVGVVESINYPCQGRTCGMPHFFGRSLDGGHWQTMYPRKLAESLEEYQR